MFDYWHSADECCHLPIWVNYSLIPDLVPDKMASPVHWSNWPTPVNQDHWIGRSLTPAIFKNSEWWPILGIPVNEITKTTQRPVV